MSPGIEVLRKIDPQTVASVPMENLIALARQDLIKTRALEVAKSDHPQLSQLIKESLDLAFDGDALLGTEIVVASAELAETSDQHYSKYLEPYTLMTLRLNPKDAARICLNGIEKNLGTSKALGGRESSLRVCQDPYEAEINGENGGKVGSLNSLKSLNNYVDSEERII